MKDIACILYINLKRCNDINFNQVIKSRKLRWADHVTRMEEGRSAFKFITGTPAGKRPLGRSRCRGEDNVRMDLKEICINMRN